MDSGMSRQGPKYRVLTVKWPNRDARLQKVTKNSSRKNRVFNVFLPVRASYLNYISYWAELLRASSSFEHIRKILNKETLKLPVSVIVIIWMIMQAAGLHAQVRYALVIGNSNYHLQDTLRNPVNDARLITKKLKECGFKVIARENISLREFNAALNEFYEDIRSVNCVALFFYAGHGMQHNGENYLVPVNADIRSPDDISYQCNPLSEVLKKLGSSQSNTNIVILDACRNDPFSKGWHRGTGDERGLRVVPRIPPQTYIAFATGPDEIANDGKGANSPFSLALSKYITMGNITLEQMFKKVSGDVRGQYPQQMPWININYGNDIDFYFNRNSQVLKEDTSASGLFSVDFIANSDCRLEIEGEYIMNMAANTIISIKRPKGTYNVKAISISDPTISCEAVSTFGNRGDRSMVSFPLVEKMMVELQKKQEEASVQNKALNEAINSIKYNLVLVDSGSFQMGSNNGKNDQSPIHKVSLSPFYMSKYEVTQSQWFAIMGTEPGFHKGCPTCPVENVSWYDAQQFIKKLNNLTNDGYRLPTEAEWEYSARGGNVSAGRSVKMEKIGWFYENADKRSHPIGLLASNEKGIFDMSGNVSEWCNDWYGDSYYKESPASNPPGPKNTGREKVIRGGSWDDYEGSCPLSGRFSAKPDDKRKTVGFRLVKSN